GRQTMTRLQLRSALVATALALLLGGATLPVLAQTPIGMRDSQQVDYGATAFGDAALSSYLSNADHAAVPGAYDAATPGRYATQSPAEAALGNLALEAAVPTAAYDAGRLSGAL